MKKIYCNISPIKDLAEPARTLEDIVADQQKPIPLSVSLTDIAIDFWLANLARGIKPKACWPVSRY